MPSPNEIPVALTIAGSDSGGGAGVQADLKTFSALGVFGCSAITAVTAQNTCAVTDVHEIPAKSVEAQILAVLDDFNVGAIKIGMLCSAEIAEVVASTLSNFERPIILDPVMIATSGDALLKPEAINVLKKKLLPIATLVTPNLPEAARLVDDAQASNEEQMHKQGRAMIDAGANAVLIKGGHASGKRCVDVLIADSVSTFASDRIDTKNTHGTGCTLSAAIAGYVALGNELEEAVGAAHEYLQKAIKSADSLCLGNGHGPVQHFHALWDRQS